MKLGDDHSLFQGRYMHLWNTDFEDANGAIKRWEWVYKRNAAFVFPVTNDQRVILIRNFRVPVKKYVIEAPAGLIDDESETPEQSARRELLEETGYEAGKMHFVGSFPISPGSSNQLGFGFIATGVHKIHDGMTDPDEDLSVLEVTMDQLLQFFTEPPADTFFDMRILSLYHLYQSDSRFR